MKFNKIVKTLTLAATLGLSQMSFAGVDTQTDANDVILAGYDAVAYFTQSKAVEGTKEFTAVHKGAIYQFSSAENRDTFKADPNKYEPAYGGYCAYGSTFGKKFEVNGKAFEIVDGTLYVNKSENVYEAWKQDIPTFIDQADEKWKNIEFKAPSEL
ncbi:YHS domain-containing (seleno)protein [Alteromonas sp. 5E99-2]|uniref:YHS domain-containing (seleno)protein n=1 Tax=Alteromonas sp. 5E99-2 TaxID=2817683 RepID=UPI001F604860|nr:YHS domain-containing (seleno)protein [Alteromonas sp. 5E99-2]